MAKNKPKAAEKANTAPAPTQETTAESTGAAPADPGASALADAGEGAGEEPKAAEKAPEPAADTETPQENTEADMAKPRTGESHFSRTAPDARAFRAGKPNTPSFDFDPETREPVLQDGEIIVTEVEKKGVKAYSTNHGRRIFACSIADYEKKFGPLLNRAAYEHYYPHAAKG